MTDDTAPWEPRPAWPQLAALASAMRPDWNRVDLWDTILAVRNAGWSWRDTYREVMRLAWAEEEVPTTLRNSARRPGDAPPVPLDPDLKASLMADLMSKRTTGGQPVLAEENERTAS